MKMAASGSDSVRPAAWSEWQKSKCVKNGEHWKERINRNGSGYFAAGSKSNKIARFVFI